MPIFLVCAVLGSLAVGGDARDRAVAAARAAIAERDAQRNDPAEVVSVAAMEWPDSSLGCPKEGMLYAQALTRGYRVVLRAGGTVHVVHVSGADVVVCGKPLTAAALQPEPVGDRLEAAAPEPEGPAQKALVAQAREDLAKRLSLEPDAVAFVKLKEVVWPDRSLGCPRPGMVYPQVPQDGVLIVLRAAGRSYAVPRGLRSRAVPVLEPEGERRAVSEGELPPLVLVLVLVLALPRVVPVVVVVAVTVAVRAVPALDLAAEAGRGRPEEGARGHLGAVAPLALLLPAGREADDLGLAGERADPWSRPAPCPRRESCRAVGDVVEVRRSSSSRRGCRTGSRHRRSGGRRRRCRSIGP